MDRDDPVGNTVGKVGFLIDIIILSVCLILVYTHSNL